MSVLEWTFLGRVGYRRALELQYSHAARLRNGARPRLLLLEHPPTITLGRSADPRHLRLPATRLAERGIQVVRVLRGGDVTYHGPGQLIGYPLVDLAQARLSVPAWVQGCAQALVDELIERGVAAKWSDLHPGVWVGQQKIAAVGFHISRRISTHGFALNLAPDMSAYDAIVPCGLSDLGVTSLAQLGVAVPAMEDIAGTLAQRLADRLGWKLGQRLHPATVLEEKVAFENVPANG